ncbi:MAG TPA: leucyl/phenylalanyl-tRNA--protein transferase [Steroidobacteraceae bacterium]
MNSIVWLSDEAGVGFPPVANALTEPDGLLAAGGDLSPQRLITAYERGIFPWYAEGQPVLWWSPDPRAVLFPADLRISRSLRKRMRSAGVETRLDSAFSAVIAACSAPRCAGNGTWLTSEMIAAYARLHELGFAHSVECWREGQLVGGLYGVCLGRVFFGESMFSRETDASKIALVRLVDEAMARGIAVIDCQITSPHLQSLGSRSIPRREFTKLLLEHCHPHNRGSWA